MVERPQRRPAGQARIVASTRRPPRRAPRAASALLAAQALAEAHGARAHQATQRAFGVGTEAAPERRDALLALRPECASSSPSRPLGATPSAPGRRRSPCARSRLAARPEARSSRPRRAARRSSRPSTRPGASRTRVEQRLGIEHGDDVAQPRRARFLRGRVLITPMRGAARPAPEPASPGRPSQLARHAIVERRQPPARRDQHDADELSPPDNSDSHDALVDLRQLARQRAMSSITT